MRSIKWACEIVLPSEERISKSIICAVPTGKRTRCRSKQTREDCVEADIGRMIWIVVGSA